MGQERDKKMTRLTEALRAIAEWGEESEADFLERNEHLRDILESRTPESTMEEDTLASWELEGEDQEIPEKIGPYRLLERIGRGGMGTVYLAEQREPVRRKVALKLIRTGLDSDEVIARFQTERQALAMMNHPNIANVLDAGTSDDGRLYFVMEYVPGVTITEYCDSRKLSVKERLELFCQACDGIQHSHQKGVIHRDLKPSNLLVTSSQSRVPIVKIIDFGIAKATEQKLTDKTLFTSQGQLIGTLEYMSPEQAGAGGWDVDTRTDIYSLGVLLYELLVGTLPLNLRDSLILRVIEKIREEEPQKPSTRISTLGERGPQFAERRGIHPRGLARELRGDLDWITLKALEKDPVRRYASVSDFAADVQRHLNLEPVLAGPPTATYRIKKFLRKHAVMTFLCGLVGIGWIGGVLVISVLLHQATGRSRDLENEKNTAKDRGDELARVNQELLSLSDGKHLELLLAEADDLWPAYPENAEKMRGWLIRARRVAENLEEHEGVLALLRRDANPGGVGEGDPHAVSFNKTEERWRYELLTELVAGLRTFQEPRPRVGMIANVEERLALAERIEEETIGRYKDRWAEAIESIATKCEAYGGMVLEEQLGLIPLDRDPRSGLWEFLHYQTHDGELPERDENGRWIVTGATGLIFVLIPGGTFARGAQNRDPEGKNFDPHCEREESPVEDVRLSAFFLSKYEMTQGQWKRFSGVNPSQFQERTYGIRHPDRHPIEHVSWEDCERALRWLGLRLPSEAQWEYAARATTTTIWWTGNERESLRGAGNFADQSTKGKINVYWPAVEEWPELNDGFPLHAPVGSFRPNAFGLHDVAGNVSEFCLDLYYGAPRRIRPGDGANWTDGDGPRSWRGGSMNLSVLHCRSAFRGFHDPGDSYFNLGVRPARDVEGSGLDPDPIEPSGGQGKPAEVR